ncbi:MAG TPA: WYL domain-containing protein [Anaerolineae bacterium]|nr:WYL domain-containing protein [Anaerolineae bacterium]
MNHATRLSYLQRLFYRRPQGYRASELAELCATSRRTINRDLETLQGEPFYLPLVLDDGWRWRLMEGHRFTLPPVHLSLQEAAALYLAARLLDRVSDEPNPYVGRALAALGEALPPEVGRQVQRVAAAHLGQAGAAFARIFEVITLGWALGRKVRIRHQALRGRNPHEYVLYPYLIEPSSVGYATYVIGHASYFDAVHTFKMERILEAELLDETFEVPEAYRGAELLAGAWGVMYGEETTEVALRFSPEAARRVRESRWHASQEVEACADGSCILRVRVPHTLEMKPWIRGWGPECEVLAPEGLRREVAEEMRRAGEVYGLDHE